MDEEIRKKIIQKWKDAKDLFVTVMDRAPSIMNAGDRIIFLKLFEEIGNEEAMK